MKNLSPCQARALELLQSSRNIFLTGVAGSGKSFLIRAFLKNRSSKEFPVLASTGAAAILVGGRTFHSFFGLGIMQGGFEATVQRALTNKKLVRRMKKTQGVVIDEVSMLSGQTLSTAEAIARKARMSDEPWGGLQIVTVGDFAQLPPVMPFGTSGESQRDWAFLDEVWEKSEFQVAWLRSIMRTTDTHFIEVLNEVRTGKVTGEVEKFLNEHTVDENLAGEFSENFEGTRLFPHRDTTEKYNLSRLKTLDGDIIQYDTVYTGQERYLEEIKRSAPIQEKIYLKRDALVMIRQNDPQGRYFNGSLGYVQASSPELLRIALLEGGTAELEKVTFSILNADGAEIAGATNFPVNLAYAATIHKAQGLTLDRVFVDLERLWEPGQAYVALSRVRTSQGLHIARWSPRSIKTDPLVTAFHARLASFV